MRATGAHLHFVQSIEPLEGGGLGKAAVDLHAAFLDAGLRSRLVTTHGLETSARVPGGPEGVKEYRRAGPAKMFFSPELARESRRAVELADIIHGHGFYTAVNMMLGGSARKLRKPLVYHVHGIFEPWILRRSVWKKRAAHWLFENANFRHARLWRALTVKEADQIRAAGISAPIVVASNGIWLSEFDSVAEAPGSGSKPRRRCLFLARIHPKKGLDLLLPAWREVAKSYPDWELVIAGPDEGGYRAEVEERVRTLDVSASVSFTGAVTGAPKVELLKSSDLFVLPSYSEGFSVAILEAMACRVPVLATTACNFPELSAAGAGWECEPKIESLRDALRQALDCSEEERAQRGELGRKLVEANHTWPEIAKTVVAACATYCG